MAAKAKPYGLVPLARLAGGLFDPVTAKRGFAKADLIASWSEIAGPRYADKTLPEKLVWPRDRSGGAVLTVRVDGPSAVFLQHETQPFIERVNAFFGYPAVAELRIVQKPVASARAASPEPPVLPEAEARAVEDSVAEVESDGLREALRALGTAVATDRLARP